MDRPHLQSLQAILLSGRAVAAGSADPTANPVLLRVSYQTGHGGGTGLSQRDQQLADAYTFLFAALGVPYRPLDTPR